MGLFSTTSVPGNGSVVGLLYGGGFRQLGIQLSGAISVGAWTVVTITAAFLLIRATIGLRASAEEELTGLDLTEHGLPSAYDGFDIHDHSIGGNIGELGAIPAPIAIPVEYITQTTPITTGASYGAFTEVVIICRQNIFEALRSALAQINVTGMTVIQVMGYGNQKGRVEYYRGIPITMSLYPKLKVEVVVSTVPVEQVIAAAKLALYSKNVGHGKIFVYNVENVVRVRTGEEGYNALVNEKPAVGT